MVKLFVGNLPPSASNQSLKEIFQQYKDLQDYKLISNYGFVYLETEESAIHAVNNLNGLEYRGFSIAIDFARDQNKLKRKADMMLDNREPRSFIPQQQTQRFCPPPIPQQRNMNPYNLPFLNTSNMNSKDRYNDKFETGNNSQYRLNILNNYPVKNVQGNGKKFCPEYFTEDDFYDFNSNNNIYDMKFQHGMYHSGQMLQRPSWYDRTAKKINNQYLSDRDRQKYIPRMEAKRQARRSYIDEYDEKIDFKANDPYPSYLKQYQK